MPTHYIIFTGLLLLLLAGCTVTRTPPAGGALQGGTVIVERLPPVAEPGGAESPQKSAAPAGTVIIERLPPLPEAAPKPEVLPKIPVAPASPAETTPGASAAATDKPAAKAPAKVAAAAPRAPQPQPQPQPQQPQKLPAATPAAPPPLALAALEQRLRDTDAIGVFTKITLKNQIDDLLHRFKAHYEGGSNTTLAQLRQIFDQLLLKAHSLLKDGDPALAGTIMNSREAIWSVLTDPVRFAKL